MLGQPGPGRRKQPERLVESFGFPAQHLLVQFQEPGQVGKPAGQQLADPVEWKAETLEREDLVQARDLLGSIDAPARRRPLGANQTVGFVEP